MTVMPENSRSIWGSLVTGGIGAAVGHSMGSAQKLSQDSINETLFPVQANIPAYTTDMKIPRSAAPASVTGTALPAPTTDTETPSAAAEATAGDADDTQVRDKQPTTRRYSRLGRRLLATSRQPSSAGPATGTGEAPSSKTPGISSKMEVIDTRESP
jgi:hypothetical protein